MKPKLFVFDFDGTALGGHIPYAQFPHEFSQCLDGLEGHGVQWATNTTWGVEEQWEVVKRSRVKSLPAFLTGQTGRQLAGITGGTPVMDEGHTRAVAACEEAFRARVWPHVKTILGELLAKDLVTRLAFDFFTPQCIVDFTAAEGSTMATWATVQPLIDSGDYYAFNPAKTASGSLLPAHMNKGEALRRVQTRLGVSPAETIVAGDGSNDLHMFDPSLARWMICPANAEPVVKERVAACGGVLSAKAYSWGIVDGIEQVLRGSR